VINGGAVVERALSELKLADHMIFVTLPLLNDRMIFLNAVTHVYNGIKMVIDEFLQKEYRYKRLESIPPDDDKITAFLKNYINRLKLNAYVEAINRIDAFIRVKAKSSVRLRKDDKFVLITPDYETVSISESEIKGYIKKVVGFINNMRSALNEG